MPGRDEALEHAGHGPHLLAFNVELVIAVDPRAARERLEIRSSGSNA
jgi:hypothetical protein